MKTIAEEIWDYIDGDLSTEERLMVANKIAHDPVYQAEYSAMMEIHQLMADTSLEEPSMSFTRNVMEQVKLEIAPVALKNKTDKRIIFSLAAIFILSIFTVAAYALVNSTMTSPEFSFPDIHFQLNAGLFTNSISLHIFLFADVLLGLLYLDKYLRRKRTA